MKWEPRIPIYSNFLYFCAIVKQRALIQNKKQKNEQKENLDRNSISYNNWN